MEDALSDGSNLDSLFQSVATSIAENDSASTKAALDAILDLIRDDGPRRLVAHNAEWVKHIMGAFLTFVKENETAASALAIIVSVCEYDSDSQRVGIINVGYTLEDASSWFKLYEFSYAAIAAGNAKHYTLECRFVHLQCRNPKRRGMESEVYQAAMIQRLEVLMTGLKVFPYNPEITAVLDLTATVVCDLDSVRQHFVDKDGIELILSVFHNYPQDEQVNLYCCKVLNAAADEKVLKMSNVLKPKDNTCGTILNCLSKFLDHEGLVREICSFLVKVMVTSQEKAKELSDAGVSSIIQNVQCKYSEDPLIQNVTGQLLIQMSCAHDDGTNDRRSRSTGSRGEAGHRSRSRVQAAKQSKPNRSRALKDNIPSRLHESKSSRSPDAALGESRKICVPRQQSEGVSKESPRFISDAPSQAAQKSVAIVTESSSSARTNDPEPKENHTVAHRTPSSSVDQGLSTTRGSGPRSVKSKGGDRVAGTRVRVRSVSQTKADN